MVERLRPPGSGLGELRNERGVFWGGDPDLQDLQHPCKVAPDQGRHIQPQTWKGTTFQKTIPARPHPRVLSGPKQEPVQRMLEGTPDQVFAYSVAAICVELLAQVSGFRTGGHL